MESENLKNLIDKKINKKIDDLGKEVLNGEIKISNLYIDEILNTNNKERMLLLFRRSLEMLIKIPFFVTVVSKSTNKIIVVRNDNLLQLLDDRYYSELQLSSFLDIFKIETNNFSNLKIIENGEPHIKLVINYILIHYNTSFRKFMNRNKEYYYMYKFFFDNGEKIKNILDCLNSYHYSSEEIIEIDCKDILNEIKDIYNNILILFEKISKNFST